MPRSRCFSTLPDAIIHAREKRTALLTRLTRMRLNNLDVEQGDVHWATRMLSQTRRVSVHVTDVCAEICLDRLP
eukprot:2793711-Rhodomonas_salina.4